ncbi:hypothetical protein [Lactobacillus sp. Sy-1]|uniref:hypothetical protein n=1 Tax=Lactobacillus sp. Sy-1 TaxID=2109645 RepID=UPI001C5B787C|nr:hypothetical protein [Lactobacillus sp. Sy-1]MBW1605858.1 hypothetical protein [Lactobacillus sp. Sy-1]
MKKSIIYLATLSTLVVGSSAIVHTVNSNFTFSYVAHAGVPNRSMLVAPISDNDAKYVTFYNGQDGSPELTDEGSNYYQDVIGGNGTLVRYAIRSTAPYVLKVYDSSSPSEPVNNDNYTEASEANDKDFLDTLYQFTFIPKPEYASTMQPITVSFIAFGADANGVNDFYSKYVQSPNTYSIKDLKTDVLNMDASSYSQVGFGTGTPDSQSEDRNKFVNELNIILKNYLNENVDTNDTPSTAPSTSASNSSSNNANSDNSNNKTKDKKAQRSKVKQAKQKVKNTQKNVKKAKKDGGKKLAKAERALKQAKKQLYKLENHS